MMVGSVEAEEMMPPKDVSDINYRQDTTPMNLHDEDLTNDILKKMEDFECVAGHESMGYCDIHDLCDNPEDDPSILRLKENDQALESIMLLKD